MITEWPAGKKDKRHTYETRMLVKHILLLLFLLLLLPGLGGTTTCSAIDGPYCLFITQTEAPRHVQQAIQGAMQSRPMETLLEAAIGAVLGSAVNAAGNNNNLAATIKSLLAGSSFSLSASSTSNGEEMQEVQAAFEVKGKANGQLSQKMQSPANVYFSLKPGNWIKPIPPPSGWIMVGLSGTIRKDRLEASIVDENGDEVTDCSKLKAEKLIFDPSNPDIAKNIEGIWKGHYACRGASTSVTLTLKVHALSSKKESMQLGRERNSASATEQNYHVSGTFDFHSKVFAGSRTKAGCVCKYSWAWKGVVHIGGVCGNPENEHTNSWCFFEPGTCTTGIPASTTWDDCDDEQQILII